METASLKRGGAIIVLICSTKYRRTEIISREFNYLTAKTHLPNVLIVSAKRTPYVEFREQSPSFEAPSLGKVRSDGSLLSRAGAPQVMGAAGLRRDCQAGGGYRKPEVGRTLLWSGGAMLPRLGLKVGRSAG